MLKPEVPISTGVGIGDTIEHPKFGQGVVREVNPPKRPGSMPTVLVDGWSVPHGVARGHRRRGRDWLRDPNSHVNISSVRVVRKAGT